MKHAYLIIAHNEFHILERLLRLLDHEQNDIFIHIDKKSIGFSKKDVLKNISKSSVCFIEGSDVQWGGYSLIECEFKLLREATQNEYMYYHLLSGVDLPLKSQEYIHSFFSDNIGSEFIGFDRKSQDFLSRIKYWYLFQDKIGRKKTGWYVVLSKIQRVMLFLQKKLEIDRTKTCECTFYKGPNWFSITHNLAMYVLNKEETVAKSMQYAFCADEIFMQTIAMGSPFKGNIVEDSLRFTDWKRGQPYTFTIEDLDLLMNSDKLWARKFSYKKDSQVVEKIYSSIKNVDT